MQYVKPKEFYAEIVKSKELNELTPLALEMLMLIAERANNRMKYRDPEDKRDCIAFAHLDLLKYWRSFNPEKSTNAFAYFTEMAKKGYAKGWNKIHPVKYAGTVRLEGGSSESDGIYSF